MCSNLSSFEPAKLQSVCSVIHIIFSYVKLVWYITWVTSFWLVYSAKCFVSAVIMLKGNSITRTLKVMDLFTVLKDCQVGWVEAERFTFWEILVIYYFDHDHICCFSIIIQELTIINGFFVAVKGCFFHGQFD